jgi:hypothetical protein
VFVERLDSQASVEQYGDVVCHCVPNPQAKSRGAAPNPDREQASRRGIGPMGLYPLQNFLFHLSGEIKNL